MIFSNSATSKHALETTSYCLCLSRTPCNSHLESTTPVWTMHHLKEAMSTCIFTENWVSLRVISLMCADFAPCTDSMLSQRPRSSPNWNHHSSVLPGNAYAATAAGPSDIQTMVLLQMETSHGADYQALAMLLLENNGPWLLKLKCCQSMVALS